MSKQKHVTVTATELVLIEIVGHDRPPSPPRHNPLDDLPQTLDDDGLAAKLHDFERTQGIRPARFITEGGGRYSALYTPKDAPRIVEWLRATNARETR